MMSNAGTTRVDLRSDIVSTPPDTMIDAMIQAWRKPRGYGMREDADQRDLEALSAEMLGMEDALFFPTCTMANQVALMLRCPPGTQVLSDGTTHLSGVEAPSTAGVAGVPIVKVEGARGHLTPEQVSDHLGRPLQETQMPIRLVWIENTHNAGGGTVMPPDDFARIVRIAEDHDVPVHVDGSRLWNAVAFHRRPPSEIVAGADSVAFSLNKGLGAPLGAVLVGRRKFIADALRVRNMLGGGFRPAGILAAAGVVALRDRLGRVAEDHARAARLADELVKLDWLKIDRDRVQTNIVIGMPTGYPGTRNDLMKALAALGVLVTPYGTHGIRMVTHGDITDDAVDLAIEGFHRLSSQMNDQINIEATAEC